jgi:alkanesulfonate monooxygenase SsuD/methylene tetrahydromethanopterin reductase-like flavin-dependent oxidoreductase (luciferase family)
MRVGVSLFFQSFGDWDRYEAAERGEDVPSRAQIPDHQIFSEDIGLGLLAEQLGFDALWTVEHHVSPYTMCTNPIQLMTYFAGRTTAMDVGTMVTVIPWHHPLRVAEDIVMLDALLGPARRALIGFGRGAGRREFNALGLDMSQSRERFDESIEVLKLALTQDRFSYHGDIYKFDDVELRPKPRDAEKILNDLYVAWGSLGSVRPVASTGLKPLIIPTKGWDQYHDEIAQFEATRAQGGYEPARPILVMCVYCAETEDKAREGAEQWMTEYGESALRHYELAGDHFKSLKGYEEYGAKVEEIKQLPREALGLRYLMEHVWGTPDQCLEKMVELAAGFQPQEFVVLMRYGQMPVEVAEKSMRLFAEHVLPAIHDLPTSETARA